MHFMKAESYLDKKTGKPQYSPEGWVASEKFDGQRAQWDPGRGQLITRYGSVVNCPKWFLDKFRGIDIPLDGELFMGYGNWDLTGLFRSNRTEDELWRRVRYMVFDIPDPDAGVFSERIGKLESLGLSSPLIPVKHVVIDSRATLKEYYEGILKRKGEGVMLNNPTAFYRDGRTNHVLKYKPIMDDECVVVGYKPGEGKYTGKLGSFIVWPVEDGIPVKQREFRISGMKDIVRSNYRKTHPIGTVLRYCCNDYTKSGVPRHPRYLGKTKKVVMLPETMDKVLAAIETKSQPQPVTEPQPQHVTEPQPQSQPQRVKARPKARPRPRPKACDVPGIKPGIVAKPRIKVSIRN